MDVLLYLIPLALVVGGIGLAGLLWAMKSGQFEDLDGAANRILFDDDDSPPHSPTQGSSGQAPTSRADKNPDSDKSP